MTKPKTDAAKQWAADLLDKRWDDRRMPIKDRDQRRCRLCHMTGVRVDVHHITYRPGRHAWEFPDCDLIVLCHDCHRLIGPAWDGNVERSFACLLHACDTRARAILRGDLVEMPTNGHADGVMSAPAWPKPERAPEPAPMPETVHAFEYTYNVGGM